MIVINGENHEYPGAITVAELLKMKNFIFPLLIVKINGTYVPKEDYSKTTIHDGAVVDVIHLMSGG